MKKAAKWGRQFDRIDGAIILSDLIGKLDVLGMNEKTAPVALQDTFAPPSTH